MRTSGKRRAGALHTPEVDVHVRRAPLMQEYLAQQESRAVLGVRQEARPQIVRYRRPKEPQVLPSRAGSYAVANNLSMAELLSRIA